MLTRLTSNEDRSQQKFLDQDSNLTTKLGPKDSFIEHMHKPDFCPTLLVKLCIHVCVKMHTSALITTG